MASVFFSYSHEDEDLRDQLEKQLAMLKKQGVIETWHDRRIVPGQDIHAAIDEHINHDEIILLLVSPDFIASEYCYEVEMARALERHHAGQATVIPVILRYCDWHGAPFGALLATPRDGKPVMSWPDIDEAFLQVAKAVREIAERIQSKSKLNVELSDNQPAISHGDNSDAEPRSSNLRLAKEFTQRDKDKFLDESFDYIARYFENSLEELVKRNTGYEGVFRSIDANRFFVTIYHEGKDVARATIYRGGMLGDGINYVQGETTASNSSNESLSVEADDQTLYMVSRGITSFGLDHDEKLSHEGAAELLWSLVIDPLQ